MVLGGIAIVLLVFGSIFGVMAYEAGWRITLAVWGFALGGTALVVLAAWMIGEGFGR